MPAQPVRLLKYENRYGLLHSDGYVQLGSGGPFEKAETVGPLERATWEAFEDYLNGGPQLVIAREPGQRGRPKYLKGRK